MDSRRLDDHPGGQGGEHVSRDAIIWEMDPRTRTYTYLSGGAENLYGYARRRWLDESDFLLRILHPDDRERTSALAGQALTAGEDLEIEYRVVTADGVVLWIRDRIHVVLGADGRPRLLQGVMVDITALKEMEQGTRRAELVARRTAERMNAVAAASADIAAAGTVDILRDVVLDVCHHLFPRDVAFVHLDGDDDGAEAGGPFVSVLRSPIRNGARVTGSIAIASEFSRPDDSSDQAVLDVVANLASMAVGHLCRSTEAERTQRVLRETTAFATLLQDVTAAAIEAPTFLDAAARVAGAVCAHAGWSHATIFERSDDGDLVSTGTWQADARPRFRAITSVANRVRRGPGKGVAGRALASAQPVWLSDMALEAALDEPPSRGGHAPRASFAFPVLVADQVAAAFEFSSAEPIEPDPELIDVSHGIGGQLARVIERERAQSQIHFQARLLDAVGQAVIASDIHHRIVYWNPAAEALFGWSRDEAIGRIDSDVVPVRTDSRQTAEITRSLASRTGWAGEYVVRHKDGSELPVGITGSVIYDHAGAPAGYLGIASDLRAGRKLEQRLREVQRLEAIGRLAGGIAHEFNNLLTSINGAASLVLEDLPPGSPVRGDIEEIRRVGDRAAGLTAQLLAFSGRQMLRPCIVDLNDVVRDALPVLRRILGDSIILTPSLDPALPRVRIDPSQFGHVLENLVLHARDAMPAVRRIQIRTAALTSHPPARLNGAELAERPHVLLEIHNDGPGISEDELQHIFEPFYSARGDGAVGGLGLSSVHGIVKQSDGHISVEGGAGNGTTFRILLPAAQQPQAAAGPPAPAALPARRGRPRARTLLLVEDEESVRRLARKILDRHGYAVLQAANGMEALEVWMRHADEIELIVTDIVMPLMTGAELADRIHSLRPDLPILLMSGYTGEQLDGLAIADGDRFIEKPFSPEALARKVRDLLDSTSSTPRP